MSKPFPDHPFLRGNFAPLSFEADARDLPVRGEFPKDLAGTLYRNGPNPQYAPKDGQYHWFVGDGMLHAFQVEDGRVHYRNRWVRTPRFELERDNNRPLYGFFGNPMTTDPIALGKDSGVANTNVVVHGGRVFALEEAHAPFEVDPHTLAPKGYETFQDKVQGRFTAHPKLDPETGEMLGFAYSVGGFFTDKLAYYVIDKTGTMTRSEVFQAPYSAMVHDFITTRNHVIFPIMPLTGSLDRAMKGKPAFAWEPEKGNRIGIMRRDASTSSIRWFQGPASYVFHPMNAWEEGDRIIADVMQYGAAPLFPNPDGTPGDERKAVAKLVRWTFDLAGNTDTYKEEPLDDLQGEFPRFDERFAGLSYRHGFYAFYEPEQRKFTGSFGGLVHQDAKSGARKMWRAPAGDAVSEPVFVPRRPDAEEGDGYLLAVVYRGEEKRSDLCAFDAMAIDAGPVGTAMLGHRVPYGFHGNFRQA